MVVLETTVVFKETILVEKLYPAGKNGEFLDRTIRNGLISSISNLAERAFQDELQSVNLGPYQIVQFSQEIKQTEKKKSPIETISMYTIAEKNTNKKEITKCMQASMNQFLNRFSKYDIFQLNTKKLQKFEDRFEKIFQKLIYSDEERLRSVF